jgi:UDP-glucose-4-epimerase GalE
MKKLLTACFVLMGSFFLQTERNAEKYLILKATKLRFLKTILSIFFLFVSVQLPCESNRVVLVTGGAGYIGSHTCKALREAGFIPVTYDSLRFGSKESVQWGPLVIGDLLDTEALDRVFTRYKPCAVLHFAALRNVGESVQDPSSYYTNNVVGSINLLNAMLKHQVKNIIFSSSCTVYGNCPESPISEEQHEAPTNPYAMSKRVVERAIMDYAHAHPFQYMILRYFNAAGVEIEAGLKRSSHSCSFLIPRAMLAILHPDRPLQIFGSNYPTPDGTCIRDYIHVKDLARAHVMALQHLQEGKASTAINLGTGTGYSVWQILQAIEKMIGKKVPYELKSRREGDVPEAVASIKKAQCILGFEPHYSDLETIITSEWAAISDEHTPQDTTKKMK